MFARCPDCRVGKYESHISKTFLIKDWKRVILSYAFVPWKQNDSWNEVD